MCTACSAHRLGSYGLARFVVGDDLHLSGFVLRIHPHQAVALLACEGLLAVFVLGIFDLDGSILTLAPLALAVDEEFGLRVVGVDEDRCHLAFTTGPSPVGEDVECLGILLPVATVEVEAVLGKASEVYGAEERRVAGPVTIVGSWFA